MIIDGAKVYWAEVPIHVFVLKGNTQINFVLRLPDGSKRMFASTPGEAAFESFRKMLGTKDEQNLCEALAAREVKRAS